jgi:ankyrin repeat protein
MLDYACEKKAVRTVRFLIDSGARLDQGKYSNPLITAVLFERAEIVRLLLDAGVDPNGSIMVPEDNDKGYTPLMMAASLENPAMLDCLLKRGADPHRTTQKGTSALSLAVRRGNVSAITKLVKLGCRASGKELRVPVTNGDLATVRTLIRAGADVNEIKRGKYGLPELAPLDIAIQERGSRLGDKEIFAGSGRGEREIRARSAAESKRYLLIIKELVAAGADVNRVTVDDSPLCRATRCGDLEVVKVLLKAGADPRKAVSYYPWTTKLQDTAIQWANACGFTKIATLLRG